MPLTWPATSLRNLIPSSTDWASRESATAGVSPLKIEHGQETETVLGALAAPMLPESSTARTLIVVEGAPWTVHTYDQDDVPVAVCQVAPPSVETSTAATTPPPASVAVPEIVVELPSVRPAPSDGEEMVAVGGVVSV